MTAWSDLNQTDEPLPAYDGNNVNNNTETDRISVNLASRPLDDGSTQVLVSLCPPVQPEGDKRAPVDIVCVIDVSASMGEPATLPAEPGSAPEVTNLRILDVVKHALRVIIASLSDDDRIAIVPFSSRASVAADLTPMDDAGKRFANVVIDRLVPDGSTNLWDGLKTAMNLLNSSNRTAGSSSTPKGSSPKDLHGRLVSVFLLTDGVPNVVPPRGHVPMLQKYLEAHPLSNFTINTFGFGYSLNSQLLLHIAEIGGGHYGFIPDLGMLGTVFVHALANTLSTYAAQCFIEIEYDETQLSLVSAVGYNSLNPADRPGSGALRFSVGEVQYGQNRDFVLLTQNVQQASAVPRSDSHILTARVSYTPIYSDIPATCTATLTNRDHQQGSTAQGQSDVLHHFQRLSLVSSINSFFPRDLTSDLLRAQRVPATPAPNSAGFIAFDKIVQEMIRLQHTASADADGQARMAIEAAHWGRWGRHYLPSLARAHALQRCGNFRDQGQMVYGSSSPIFLRERDRADETFDKLPPPRPGNYVITQSTPASGRPATFLRPHPAVTHITSMDVWNSRSGPCFAGGCLVQLQTDFGESLLQVDELRRGHTVATLIGPRRVAAVLRTRLLTKSFLCTIGDLLITPWHPVLLGGTWQFPVNIAPVSEILCDAVYSVLLEPSTDPDAHSMFINDIPCVTLGSGALLDIRAHTFLSDYSAVLSSLSHLPHSFDGLIECVGTKRGGDGMIRGFVAV